MAEEIQCRTMKLRKCYFLDYSCNIDDGRLLQTVKNGDKNL